MFFPFWLSWLLVFVHNEALLWDFLPRLHPPRQLLQLYIPHHTSRVSSALLVTNACFAQTLLLV